MLGPTDVFLKQMACHTHMSNKLLKILWNYVWLTILNFSDFNFR